MEVIDEIHAELWMDLSKSHLRCNTRKSFDGKYRKKMLNLKEVNCCGKKKIALGDKIFQATIMRGDAIWWQPAFKRPLMTVDDLEWTLIGRFDWGLLLLSRLMGSAMHLQDWEKRYCSTCKFKELSDWLEEMVKGLDWAERKTRWLRQKKKAGGWEEAALRRQIVLILSRRKNKHFSKCRGCERCNVRLIWWG